MVGLALLSGSETYVHYTVQIFCPVREKLCSFELGPALRDGLALRSRCLSQREGHKLLLGKVHVLVNEMDL